MPQVHILSYKNNDNLLDIFSLELYGQTLIKHADVLGYGGYSAQQLQRMLPELESALKNLFSQMKLKRIGQWSGFQNAKYFTGNGKMIVTQSDGTFITTINKTSNAWFQKAIPIK